MKPNRWLLAVYLTSCCWLIVLPSFAQDRPSRGTVTVPFDFYIAGERFLAGDYSLEIIAPTYVMLRTTDGKVEQTLYFVQTAGPDKSITPIVRFAMRKGQYYFAEVWTWYGKAQLTSFFSQPGDDMRQVPLSVTSVNRASPAP